MSNGELLHVNRTCPAASSPRSKRTARYEASNRAPFALTDSAKGLIDTPSP